jgi:hypothetical protein
MGPGSADLDWETWSSPTFDFWTFDRELDGWVEAGRVPVLAAPGHEAPDFLLEVLTRAQRCICRRNAASSTPAFERVLKLLRARHDLSRPLVRADYDHALDCWQWVLRLEPQAGAAPQLAALLHDVERLDSESLVRIEQAAPDYPRYKRAHARAGAEIAFRLLEAAGIEERLAREAAFLVHESETPGFSPGVQLVNDADALSFFSLNSAGFLDYFGEGHTRKKLNFTLARMSPRARAELPRLRLRPELRALLGPDGD